MMNSLGDHLIDIETLLNGHLGFDPARPLNGGDTLHQFVFSPTFHSPSTLVLEQSVSGTTAYLAVLFSSVPKDGKVGCWQDIQPVAPEMMDAFSTAALVAKPWELPNVDTNSRDGILAGYRIQSTERSARFYAFNPIYEDHPSQIAWLKRGLCIAQDIFQSADAVLYLESLQRYFVEV
ncbi:hypothetical protein [Pantanalinema sp. GBBB05]|uniref:hypothetical protein n=1 Tax=Pantanalinema sp. GBBB05 TaxID=2604139 RepID=UPI001D8C8D4B|nr:hypothetical protein [Pantanalinema sp. GBBB05]